MPPVAAVLGGIVSAAGGVAAAVGGAAATVAGGLAGAATGALGTATGVVTAASALQTAALQLFGKKPEQLTAAQLTAAQTAATPAEPAAGIELSIADLFELTNQIRAAGTSEPIIYTTPAAAPAAGTNYLVYVIVAIVGFFLLKKLR